MRKRNKKMMAMITAAALLVGMAGCGGNAEKAAGDNDAGTIEQKGQSTAASESGKSKVGVVIKIAGNPFYAATDRGFAEAGEELGVEFITNGPSEATVEGQIQIIEGFINQKVDAIAIATNDFDAVSPALKKAEKAGIKVLSWDSAVNPQSRALHVNQADTLDIGSCEIQGIAEAISYEGQIAVVSGSATMVNQNAWIDAMKTELEKEEYEKMELVDVVYGDEDSQKTYNETLGLVKTYPDLKGIVSPTTAGLAAVCKAIEDQGLTGKIMVTGIGLPSLQADYIKSGLCQTAYIWNPIDLGYLAAYASDALLKGEITGAIGDQFDAGRLGSYEVIDDGAGGTEVILGPPLELTADNIDEYKEIF
ncbi:MAG: rhamnose ABC transporter substrate-binding protein [Blautia sp.]|jgi:rhamnose transport system substrate-binding protein